MTQNIRILVRELASTQVSVKILRRHFVALRDRVETAERRVEMLESELRALRQQREQ